MFSGIYLNKFSMQSEDRRPVRTNLKPYLTKSSSTISKMADELVIIPVWTGFHSSGQSGFFAILMSLNNWMNSLIWVMALSRAPLSSKSWGVQSLPRKKKESLPENHYSKKIRITTLKK